MEVNIVSEIKDGDGTRSLAVVAPSSITLAKQKSIDGPVKKKRRRGKSKRKVMKPFMKMPWPDRKRNDKTKRNNRFRKLVLAKTHAPAPFNNNQFLMEIHKPEPENDFQILQTPSARTRDSSFSVDSEENYFYSLPEDEEDFLTKEFSSVYEDAQSERLANMSKDDLIQEYLLLEAKYETLVKRTERSKSKHTDDDDDRDTTGTERDTSGIEGDSMTTDKDASATSIEASTHDGPSIQECILRLKDQEDLISELKLSNEKLQLENEHLRQKSRCSSSEDSESDSSSTSISCSSSSRGGSPINDAIEELNDDQPPTAENHHGINGQNGTHDHVDIDYPLVNGHSLIESSQIDEV